MKASVRTLGELVARNAIDDPQLVSAEEAGVGRIALQTATWFSSWILHTGHSDAADHVPDP